MTDYEDLFRKVARQLLDRERAAKRTLPWSKKEIEDRLNAEAAKERLDLGRSTPLDQAKRVMRIQKYYLELKEDTAEPKFAAVFDPTMPMSPKLHKKAEELGFRAEGEWRYIEPQEIDPAKKTCKHPRTGPDTACPTREIPVRIPYTEDGIEYLVAFCAACSSGWWSARKPAR